MSEKQAKALSGNNNKKLNNKQPTHNEASTEAIFDYENRVPHSEVGLPSEKGVINAKEWVDNGSRL